MRYQIRIEQTHSYMSNKPYANTWVVNEISDFSIPSNCFTQIGHHSNYIYCLNLHIKSSGLMFPVYGTKTDMINGKTTQILNELHNFISDDAKSIHIHLAIKNEVIHANQDLIIKKIA